jgi:hypothetical protein
MTTRTTNQLETYSLHSEPLFPPGLTHSSEHKLENGTVILATSDKDGNVRYSAHDANGNPLKIKRIRLSNGAPRHGLAEAKCYFCFCDDNHCQCSPEPCPDPPAM